MRKRNKKHWVERLPSLACGGIARPGSAKDTCGLLWVHCGASVYRDLATANPDWYCVTCAKAARLALAAESAPNPDAVVWPKPRPISEAPKDGSMVLICVPGCDPQWTIGVFGPRQCWIDRLAPSAAAVVKPTHFLPLPPSPEVK